MARFRLPGGQRYEVAAQYWMPSVTAVVLLFMGGWFAASFSQADDAGGAFVTTMTVKGKVVRVKGQPVRVLVPAHTVLSKGQVVSKAASTINLTQTRTLTDSLPGKTVTGTVTERVEIPTTLPPVTVTGPPTTLTITETVPTVTETQTTTVTETTTTTAPPTS